MSISIDCFDHGDGDSLPDWVSDILRSRTSNGEASFDLRRLCSEVETLILDLESTLSPNVAWQALLHRIAINEHFPKLQHFKIYADLIKSDTLLAFLRNKSRLASLSLRRLIHTKREWEEVFLLIKKTMPNLDQLVLDQVQIRDQENNASSCGPPKMVKGSGVSLVGRR